MSNTSPILAKDDVVKYLMHVSELDFNTEISRIKLQKGLYFLYAFWTYTISKSEKDNNELSDLAKDLSFKLFEPSFVAWSYGPVDKDVYNQHREGNLQAFNEFEATQFISEQSELVQIHLRDMTRRILSSSDFGLVDLSHRDSAWSNVFNEKDPFPNEIITHEAIVQDYANK